MPKKFKFRLEPVLRLREYRSESAKMDLASVIGLKMQKIEASTLENQNLESSFLESPQKLTLFELQAMESYRSEIKEKIKNYSAQIETIEKVEIEKRQALAQAIKEEKILSKLKEKQKARHQEEALKEEMKFLDEIATNNFIKSRMKDAE